MVLVMVSTPAANPARIASLLGPDTRWTKVECVPESPSTNLEVSQRAAAGEPEGLVLVANHQTRGEGRFQRRWEDTPGTALAFSALVRPTRPLMDWGWLSLLAGVAVAEGIRQVSGAHPSRVGVKWPNDVLLDDRKVCGILNHGVSGAAVIGIGINTSMDETELPVPAAISLRLASLPDDKDELLAAILARLQEHYEQWQASGEIRKAYEANCATIGRVVRVQLDDEVDVHGTAVGVDQAGNLIVRTHTGERSFAAGDVFHLR